ncbi:MAG: hypothetical protein KDA21_05930, partial [Phycisphaerales bacterium]|nr:hypothetical protein [Phycisphaerales bacterium]
MPEAPAPRRISDVPTPAGYFGDYGGIYVPETLMAALEQLAEAWDEASRDPAYHEELNHLLTRFVGRPTQFFEAARLQELAASRSPRGTACRIWLKREDLAHTGAHKI